MNQLINIVSYFLEHPTDVISTGELAAHFQINMEEREAFQQQIKGLIKAGFLSQSKKRRLMLIPNKQWVIGRFLGHKEGYGFVTDDVVTYFVPAHATKGAVHQDIVLAYFVQEGNPTNEGAIVSVLKRSALNITGVYTEINEDGDGFVIPMDNQIEDIFIPFAARGKAQHYDHVICEIVTAKKNGRKAEGRVVTIITEEEIGEKHLESIVEDRGIPTQFSNKAIKEADAASYSEKDKAKRLDLRDKLIFTIDGVDAKDLDDAVSIDVLPNGHFYLGVHIADVAQYVKEGTTLDKEAFERGTSVYFPNKVIPMLPSKLSNDLCSLHPHTDKLTLSVFMEIDGTGAVRNYSIHEAIINSKYRFNYDEVTDFLTGVTDELVDESLLAGEWKDAKAALEDNIIKLGALAFILNQKRLNRGAISFHRSEAKVSIDDAGNISIQKRSGSEGHRLIEEAMLVCNETIAKHFMKSNIPFVYRIHQAPQEDKMDAFEKFIARYGHEHHFSDSLSSIELQNYLKEIADLPEYMTFQFYLLRCMMQARYEPVCQCHFGLAAEHYSHFTSPIRRYPDLMIHRIVKASLNHQLHEGLKNEWAKKVDDVSKHCSKRERIAEQAEKDYFALQKIKWGEQNRGEVFEAHISDMKRNSFEVVLDNTVTIQMRFKSNEIILDEQTMSLEVNGVTYKLGDKLFVELTNADWFTHELYGRVISKA